MRSLFLLESLNDVRAEYISEAAPGQRQRKQWIRWSLVAACACLAVICLLIGTEPRENTGFSSNSLPLIPGPSETDESMGFEGRLYYTPEDLENGNPWREGMDIDRLPVYRSGSYDPSEAGEPAGLTESEMKARLEAAADASDAKILQTEKMESLSEGQTVCGIRAVTEEGIIQISADGTIQYELPAEGYPPNSTEMTKGEAESAMKALVERYKSLLGYASPRIALSGDYSDDGSYMWNFRVYDATETETGDILNYSFDYSIFNVTDSEIPEERKLFITKKEGLLTAELLGEYPLITEKQAEEKLLAGEYRTSVPYPVSGADSIVKTELIYREGPLEEYLLPYYRFYVKLPVQDGWNLAEGLSVAGIYYVPAIQEQYLSE